MLHTTSPMALWRVQEARRIFPLLLMAFLWPWQQYHARHHHIGHRHARVERSVTRTRAPDCAKINAAAKALPPARYERALRSATKAEQNVIVRCEDAPW